MLMLLRLSQYLFAIFHLPSQLIQIKAAGIKSHHYLPQMKNFLPALALAFLGTAAIGWMALAPKEGAAVAVLFPPGMERDEMLLRVSQAGWLPVSYLNGNSMLAAPSNTSRSLVANGALLVLDAASARGCTL